MSAKQHLDLTCLFQFQTGSIKSRPSAIGAVNRKCQFQFQTGSIKRQIDTSSKTCVCQMFQFQTGSIKRPYLVRQINFRQNIDLFLLDLSANTKKMTEWAKRVVDLTLKHRLLEVNDSKMRAC